MNKAWKSALWLGAAAAGSCAAYSVVRRARALRNRGVARGKQIVIVGAGFGGREAALECARLLPGPDNGEITLIDERPYLLFTPMLTEAAGGVVQERHITSSVHNLPARVRFRQGTASSIDLSARSVQVKQRPGETLLADHLVLALGSSPNFHHIPGAEENALTMKTLDDADLVFHRVLQLVDEARRQTGPARRTALLTFVVAGGGYTGVETMAALNDLVREEACRKHGISPDDVRMILVEPLERLMTEVTPDLAAYSQEKLEQRGVRVLLKVGLKHVTGTRWNYLTARLCPVTLSSGLRVYLPIRSFNNCTSPRANSTGFR